MKEYRIIVNGEKYLVEIEETTVKPGFSPKGPISKKNEDKILVQKNIGSGEEKLKNKENKSNKVKEDKESSSEGLEIVTAPIPGTIFTIAVKVGDKVSEGDVLLILEAMKMENEIIAPKSGIIIEIKTKQGASVNVGDTLIIIEGV